MGSLLLLYIALLDRAPDAEGMDYWQNRSGISYEQIAENMMFYQTESPFNKYSPGDAYAGSYARDEIIDKLYSNIFERNPTNEEKNYFLNGVGADIPAHELPQSISEGIYGRFLPSDDRNTLSNKISASNYYSLLGLDSETCFKKSQARLAVNVNSDPASLVDSKSDMNEWAYHCSW